MPAIGNSPINLLFYQANNAISENMLTLNIGNSSRVRTFRGLFTDMLIFEPHGSSFNEETATWSALSL